MATPESPEAAPDNPRFVKQLCIVYNLTTFDAAGISVTHWLFHTDNQTTGDAGGNSIDTGQSFKFEIVHDTDVDTGHYDDDHWWNVNIDFPDGTTWQTRSGERCNLETRDVNSGRPVYVLLHEKNIGWSLTYPVSGACMRRKYEYCGPQ